MKQILKNKTFIKYLNIMIGCTLVAITLNVFLKPNGFVLGGVTGLGIILESIFQTTFGINFPVWLSNILINLPLFLIAYRLFGFKFLGDTIFATFFISFALAVTGWLPTFTEDIFLAAIFGAVLDGVGLGIIIKSRCSTGGSDLLAIIINKFLKHVEISKLLLCIDGTIISIGVIVFGVRPTLYAIMSSFILTKVIGIVIDGFDFAKAVFIISDKYDEIGHSILNIIDRGATSLDAKGMYTQNKKNVIFCIVKQKQIPELKEMVANIDESAFVVIANVSEVIGTGFKGIVDKKN